MDTSCLADSSDAPLQLFPGPRGVFGGGTGGANSYRASRANFQGVPEPRQHVYLPRLVHCVVVLGSAADG